MAYIKLKVRYASKYKSLEKTIQDCLDYGMNPEKTQNGKFVSTYQCSPETATQEFILSKKIYGKMTGRSQPMEREILSYLIIQSFPVGEVSPEKAHEIGYELAKKYTRKNHQFVVSTHIDREHIHNHIEINSTNLACNGKFNNAKNSVSRIRKLSDRLCRKYGLSVIETDGMGKNYGEWKAEKSCASNKEKLKNTIDRVLPMCGSFAEFLSELRREGYEVKQGKQIAFRVAGQERFMRGKRIGEDYTETALRKRIQEKEKGGIGNRSEKERLQAGNISEKIHQLIDIQAKLQAGKGPGYERWAALFNLQEAAKTLNFLTEKDVLSYTELDIRIAKATADFQEASSQIKQTERRMKQAKELQKHIQNYARTRKIYEEYCKGGKTETFRKEHQRNLSLYEAAKKEMAKYKGKELPGCQKLQEEYQELLERKALLYQAYQTAKKDLLDYQTAKQNIDEILRIECQKEGRKRERGIHKNENLV